MPNLNRPITISVVTGLTSLLTLASSIPISLALEADGRGNVYTAFAISAVLSAVLGFGMPATLRVQFELNTGALGKSFLAQFFVALCLSVAVMSVYFELPQLGNGMTNVVLLSTATALNTSAANFLSILLAKRHFISAAILMSAGGLGQASAGAVILLSGLSEERAAGVMFAAFALSSLASVLFGILRSKAYRTFSKSGSTKWSFRKSSANTGSVIIQSLVSRLDLAVVYLMLGSTSAGNYSLAWMLFLPVIMVYPALQSSLIVFLLRSKFDGESHRGMQVLSRLSEAMSLGAFISIPIAASAFFLVPMIFGPEFLGALKFVVPISISATLALAVFLSIDLLIAIGRGAWTLGTIAISTAFFLALSPLQLIFNSAWIAWLTSIWLGAILILTIRQWKQPWHSLRISPKLALRALKPIFASVH